MFSFVSASGRLLQFMVGEDLVPCLQMVQNIKTAGNRV